jgi:hypothetical protein
MLLLVTPDTCVATAENRIWKPCIGRYTHTATWPGNMLGSGNLFGKDAIVYGIA